MRLPLKLFIGGCLWLPLTLAAAGEGNLQYNFYSSDSGVVNTTPAFEFSSSLGNRTQLQMQYSLDAVSAASLIADL